MENTNPNMNEQEENNIQENLKNLTLNANAKLYIPKKGKATEQPENIINKPENLNLNLNAEEFKPKSIENAEYYNALQVKQFEDNENEEEDSIENEELEMIVNDLVENDALEELEEEEESDDEKWFPKYKDCECCKGFIYKCKGNACINMGVCYCKMKDECDDEF